MYCVILKDLGSLICHWCSLLVFHENKPEASHPSLLNLHSRLLLE